MMSYFGRNIEIVTLDTARYMVCANTSSMGIGVNEDDTTIVFPYILGRIKARTVLGELFAVGAELSMISITIFTDQNANGDEIVRGIRDELSTVSDINVPIQTSFIDDQDNKRTGLVIMALGTAYKNKIKVAASRSGDYIYALGTPKMTHEINSLDDQEIAKLFCISDLAGIGSVHEIMLLENQSIRDALSYLSYNTGLSYNIENPQEAPLDSTGNAGTCLVFTCAHKVRGHNYNGIGLFYIGRME